MFSVEQAWCVVGYAELHCRTSFSFLSGASQPRELVQQAMALSLDTLAITDLSGVYGIVRAWEARRKLLEHFEEQQGSQASPHVQKAPELSLIYGSELELDDPQSPDSLVLLARDRAGYATLSTLITRGRLRAEKGEFRLTQAEVRQRGGAGLIVLAGGPRSRLMRLLRRGELNAAERELAALRAAFGDALYLELTRHHRPGDEARSWLIHELGRGLGVPAVATNDVFFHQPHRKKLHDVMTCIRNGTTLREAGRLLLPNAERCLKSEAKMRQLFRDMPEAVDRTMEVASRCEFELTQLHYSYPREAVPPQETADDYLARLARQGLVERMGPQRARELKSRLEHELSTIAELGYAGYFLTMWEVVRFCERNRILCQGRGSAANSLACYALRITSVSPDQIDMLFERFVSRERKEPPDIDLDIEHDRREEVIQHVYEKYGREHAAMVCEVICYRHRSAVRDVGKVLGFDEPTLNRITRYLSHAGFGYGDNRDQGDGKQGTGKQGTGKQGTGNSKRETTSQTKKAFDEQATGGSPVRRSAGQPGQRGAGNEACPRGGAVAERPGGSQPPLSIRDQAARAAGLDPRSRSWQQLILLAELLVDFPRHLSIHVGGFLLSHEPIATLVPIENGRMPDRTVLQWDKDDIEALGLFKVDLLGLGMLNVIARAFRFVEKQRGIELDLASVPQGDPDTYRMVQHGDTVGVFQIESRAQMNMLPRLRPRDFYDLVIEVALVRPGPIQGGMVHPYLRRRRGEEPVEYPHPRLEKILWRTLGVPIFQEQVMRVAVEVGGYTPGEADQLRRDMAAWRRSGNMERHQKRLYESMRRKGIKEQFAARIIKQIEGFGSYGFPESHAAAFAHLVYISSYLKRHYPAEFAAALINAQPMGFYQVSSIVADAHRHGVKVAGVDVLYSNWETEVVTCGEGKQAKGGLRLGLRLVRELSQKHAYQLLEAREAGIRPFRTISELARRARLPRKALMSLAMAGAFRSLEAERREAVWEAAALGGSDLVANLDMGDRTPFAPLTAADRLRLDYRHAQSFIEDHPMRLLRETLTARRVLTSSGLLKCRPGDIVQVAGLVIVRQRPGGGRMIFMALEDESGLVDIAVPLDRFARYRSTIMLAEVLLVRGKLQLDNQARSIFAHHFENISASIGAVKSRDFH
jgi:error-prone DNA polymerase